MIEALALFVFPALMLFSAFSDMFTMTIPNYIAAALVIVFFALALYLQMPVQELAMHVSCGLVVLAVTFGLFYFKMFGGGDAKLASATALWLGWDYLLAYGVYTALAGGVLSIVVLLSHWDETPPVLSRFKFISRLRAYSVPYGVALAIGALLAYPHSDVFTRIGVA